MFGDVHVTKSVLRWRTALILRELEDEIAALRTFRAQERKLGALMEREGAARGASCAQARLALQRRKDGYGPAASASEAELTARLLQLREQLDAPRRARSRPLAKASTELSNPRWGLLMRAGNDKSHLARQVERYADIYTSRVSNLLFATPFVYLRSPRGSLPHDPALPLPGKDAPQDPGASTGSMA